jgi:hypothetical protein
MIRSSDFPSHNQEIVKNSLRICMSKKIMSITGVVELIMFNRKRQFLIRKSISLDSCNLGFYDVY